MGVLIAAFQLRKQDHFNSSPSNSTPLPTAHVHGVYTSEKFPWLRVIDKENGGKADALNAGLNYSQFPLYCCVDADGVLEQNCLKSLARPFVEDPEHTVAVGGTVRIANGCLIEQGCLKRVGLPRSWLARMQVLEYIRAFLLGRMGWSSMNALLIISGALGLFRRDVVVEVGGYTPHLMGEDMELVMRIHRVLRERKQPYKVVYVPDPVCWTEAPQSIGQLKRQREPWQRGMCESLQANRSLFMSRNGGMVGSVGFGFLALFEGFGPLLELAGLLFLTGKIATNSASSTLLLFYFGLSMGLGLIVTFSALLIEELNFKTYPRLRDLAWLAFFCSGREFCVSAAGDLLAIAGHHGLAFCKQQVVGRTNAFGVFAARLTLNE